ncbi:MAG: hypothetical protein AAB706_02180 [Patescibacteria group bacterium]
MIKFLFNWKYRHFKTKIRSVERTIEDLNFKRFKIAEIREEVRKEYDNLKAKLAATEQEIKKQAENLTAPKEEVARLEDQKIVLTRDTERKLAQLKEFDLEISGCKPNQDYQDGRQGINDQLGALQELKQMLIEYVKEI